MAIGRDQVEVQLADSATLFQQFRWGRMLRVASAGRVLSFKLTDTSLVLPELLRCVSRYAGTSLPHAAGNFFTPPPAPASAPEAGKAAARA
ncbi:MAG: hypothetical protein IRZ09_13950 [Variibacter sp.]|nr:hypothetical protein [Variibacter sp.]